MDNTLWTQILAFDLDHPLSEYGFTTRLAHENYWTKNFTRKAILEYKKFMYLAAASGAMVSPSEIIDTVWHQHLIFTQSYAEFCDVIGKPIQHIPSTHNREDARRFRQAKEHTKSLYESIFGAQPAEIWHYSGMYESLELPKARFNLRTILVFGMLAFMALLIPFYFILKPLYIHIDNPFFIIGYIFLAVHVFVVLNAYNKTYLRSVWDRLPAASFVYDLHPSEMVYLEKQHAEQIVHHTVSQLVDKNKISVNNTATLCVNDIHDPDTVEEFVTLETLQQMGSVHYGTLLSRLVSKPVFSNVSRSIDAFIKYFNKSSAFGRLYYLNFAVLLLIMLLGTTRFFVGILRDKPVFILMCVLIILVICIITFLRYLVKQVAKETIPQIYIKATLPERQLTGHNEWQFFLYGTTALSASFVPVIQYVDKKLDNSGDAGSSCGGTSSCGNSCGSSCGSSCGGCGGD